MIQRPIYSKITKWLDTNKIILLIGARQVGKTTLLQSIQQKLQERDENTLYIPVDDEPQKDYYKSTNAFLAYLKKAHGLESTKKLFVFLDEIQYLSEAGRFLKTVFDAAKRQQYNLQLIVSGSSALQLTKNAGYLTGRKIEFTIHHFSFFEYLQSASEYSYSQKIPLNNKDLAPFYADFKNDLEHHFTTFAYWGGYPEVVTTNEREKKYQILSEIVKTYIDEDIRGLLHVEHVTGFLNLISILASQTGNLMNKYEIRNTLNMHNRTLDKYLAILQGTYLFDYVRPHFTNLRKELTKMPKVFAQDMGMIAHTLQLAPQQDYRLLQGALIENVIYTELIKQLPDYAQIKFYRTVSGAEIDFIVDFRNALLPIEVKFRKKTRTIPVAMKNFAENESRKTVRPIIVTQDYLHIDDHTVFIPAVIFPFIDLNQQ